ncbi:MAG: hypothetical protein G01um101433_136 [Parcubacteria group bacterium Gr01-1014_33]|nr:MAG: hypothetical protein G01um101433_136 [Parcubacteria group bacterium Gr01-1014_33]
MPTFQYNARTKEGEMRTGVVEAFSQEAALEALHKNGLIVVSLGEKKRSLLNFSFNFGVRQKDVVIFSRQLATLFEAQIPVVQSLKTLGAETGRAQFRAVITEITDDVTGGMSLSQAMGKHPKVFSMFYISLVRSAQETGRLQEVMTYLADYLERSYSITTKARNALIYPAFVLFAFIGVLVVMLVVVIPRLVSIFEETKQEIPIYTKMIIGLSLFLQKWGLLVLIVFIVGVVALWRWGRTPAGKRIFHELQISVPIFGELYRKLYMARLTDNLRTLISGGVPLIRALSITADVVGNVIYREAIENAIESVKGGNTISDAFERVRQIPPLVTQMIRIGEVSGRLDFILGNISKFYQRDVDSLLDNLITLIEPALIILLGGAVGIIVASVLVPLYNLAGSI